MSKAVSHQILNNILIRGLDDNLQYAELRAAVLSSGDIGGAEPSVLEVVVQVVLALVDGGYAHIGPIDRSVQPWQVAALTLPVGPLSELLYSAFDELGEPPALGGVLWLELTRAGREVAERLVQ